MLFGCTKCIKTIQTGKYNTTVKWMYAVLYLTSTHDMLRAYEQPTDDNDIQLRSSPRLLRWNIFHSQLAALPPLNLFRYTENKTFLL